MDTEYQFVAETPAFITSVIPMLIHLFVVLCEVFVATFLGIQGLAMWIDQDGATPGQMRWGRLPIDGWAARPVGAALLLGGLLILAPVATGVSLLSSVVGLSLSVGFLFMTWKRSETGRGIRKAVSAAALLSIAFLVWEGEDPAAQTRAIVTKMTDWRSREIAWQVENDRRSPKLGDLAPDFELSDSEGANSIRLSTFRGDRPVALVFGSYT